MLLALAKRVGHAGARLLERWLAAPAKDLAEIRRRQAAVGELLPRPIELGLIAEKLGGVRDIPRILGRLQNRLRNPRELGGIRDTLAQLPELRAELAKFPPSSEVSNFKSQIQELPALRQLLAAALADELPADLNDGNFIRTGFDAELDRLRALTSGKGRPGRDVSPGPLQHIGEDGNVLDIEIPLPEAAEDLVDIGPPRILLPGEQQSDPGQ